MPASDDDDIYNDPDTIGSVANDDDDVVDGAPKKNASDDDDGLSQSILLPEKDTTDLDDRGTIDELEEADGGEGHDEMADEYPEDDDPDSMHLGDVNPMDEQDSTES